jgi:SAM-dependent methyltransferase
LLPFALFISLRRATSAAELIAGFWVSLIGHLTFSSSFKMHSRIHPPIYLPTSVLLRHSSRLMQVISHSEFIKQNTVIYDYGCGTMPYREMFSKRGSAYKGFDIPSNARADHSLDAEFRMPVADNSGEVVLSTYVLEHVPAADTYLRECRRALKTGGVLVLSTHGFFNYHGCPEDYRRWTLFGLKFELEQAGFEVSQSWAVLPGSACAVQLLQHQITRGLPRIIKALFFASIQSMLLIFARKPVATAPVGLDACAFVLVARKN